MASERPIHGDVWTCEHAGSFTVMVVCHRHHPPCVTGYWHDEEGIDPHRHGTIPLPVFLLSFRLSEREETDDDKPDTEWDCREYVRADRLAAVERERDEAEAEVERKQVCIDALTEVIKESSKVYVERDDLRARVEELEAALRSALASCEEAADGQCDCTGYYRCNTCPDRIARDAEAAAEILRALLSGGEEPRADTGETCDCGHLLTEHVERDGEPHVVCVVPLDTFPDGGFHGVCPCVRRPDTTKEDRER